MRVLAIETVGTTGSVALLQGDAVVAESVLDPAQRSAQSLAPAIDELLRRHGWQPAQVELVAVATGPGSFTGLRIGVATAKVLAYAVGCPILDVDTMSAIAWRVPRDVERFSVVVDAQRGELFVADFERTADGRLSGGDTTRIVDAAQWIAALEGGRTGQVVGARRTGRRGSDRRAAVGSYRGSRRSDRGPRLSRRPACQPLRTGAAVRAPRGGRRAAASAG
jgi:tRNA threonylcarbamoyl adenosine modification protein YeaZ